ncbi:MAG TPA: carboxypeptidase-like regulatory domain-containing protein [Candidatus Acidoferrum sp.]|nr:carboxypeptidase-like regulatory domain-containing protein [Candidatus Acidoferrum sp.]
MRGWRRLIIFVTVFSFLPLVVSPQNPSSSQPAPAPQTVPAESTNKKKSSSRHQHDFLIKGTVFTEEGLSFAGARIQIRKAGQKSYRWKDVANSRGEFAIRVVQGAQYEVSVSGKGSAEQKKTVDATGSDRVEELVFHMEREGSKPS